MPSVSVSAPTRRKVRRGLLDRDVYSARELAEVLGVNRETIHAWIRNGELAATKLGGPAGFRIIRAAVEELLRKREVSRH